MIEDIITALLLTHPQDFSTIKRYIAFIKFRRMMYDHFYAPVHWVKSARRVHGVR
jgi:hypothetical protein